MKVVILAGGFGTRISEETHSRPKPMIEIGNMPLLWHIMKIYSSFNFNDFLICCGYKGYMIKEYFANYSLHMSDITIDLTKNNLEVHQKFVEPWKITLVDTGINTQTGGRLKRIKNYLEDETFCFTYGDGLSDINISACVDFHKNSKNIGTVTAVQPPGRFGALQIENNTVKNFQEKPQGDSSWINGGFFVFEPSVFDYIEDDDTILERKPLEILAEKGKLGAYKHSGFWQGLDTLRDKNHLENLWNTNSAPWKLW
ncbi:glucose-1-phosphate cytidylyltransferase [Nitrosopumilus sp.]|uniref:glucose-1-phosphate cytidylyltransferase n=1 Tax=Nitrosopumilus sp. TaxID=2024843 RepID=UPI003D1529AA